MNITIRPKQILRYLLIIIGLLLFANTLGLVSRFCLGHDSVYGLVQLFDFNREGNIPSLYSSAALLSCSGLLFLVAHAHHERQLDSCYPWLGLAVIFLFLSLDETFSIHELLSKPVRDKLGTSGFLYHSWIIPYTILLLIFVSLYAKFLLDLPPKTRWLFILSGVIFVSGSIGFEMLGGKHVDLYGSNNAWYSFYYTCEELLEMIGVALFIYSILEYMVSVFGYCGISIRQDVRHE